ncbi:holin [Microbacterium arborescens]
MKLSRLTDALWWKSAAMRALYTAIAIALPYLGGSLLTEVPWTSVISAGLLGGIASVATSLAGLPEADGVDLPWWLAAVERTVKTFGQALAAGLVGPVLLTDVDWLFVLQAAALAALVSLLRLILATLPADPTPALAVVETAPTVNVVHTYEADHAPLTAHEVGGGARAPGGDASSTV